VLRPRSLQARLTLTFAAIAGATLAAAATLLDRQIRTAIWTAIDAALLEEADLLSALPPGWDLSVMVAQVARERDHGPRKFVLVQGRDGEMRAQAGGVPRRLRRELPRRRTVTRELWVDGSPRGMRLVRYDTPDEVLVIGVDAGTSLHTLGIMRRRLVAGAIGTFLLLTLLAWLVTKRATRELQRLAHDIEAIEASTLDRRLSRRDTLEVDALVVVLDRLLARLDAAVGHLRRFTADAAHELRTPIAALRATIEVALGHDRAPERWRNGLLDGLEQAERLARLSEDLLALSAVDAGAVDATRVPLRLDLAVAEVAAELEPIALEQRRPFRWDVGPGAWVSGSPALLRRVVANLIDNALRHTPPTSAIAVQVTNEHRVVRVTVTDEGPGIAPEDCPRLFERFGRGQGASGGGVGLGLALSREIADRHGGSLDVESDPQHGTRATLALLLAPPAAADRRASVTSGRER
jgi:two-component system, OmpR family, heavy metal sensor histidine kinase CusS